MNRSGRGDGVESGACISWGFDATSGADMTIGVTCTLGGTRAIEKAAQLGLFLMCKLRSEEYQPTDFY